MYRLSDDGVFVMFVSVPGFEGVVVFCGPLKGPLSSASRTLVSFV